MVDQLQAAGMSQRGALDLLGIATSTWHYRHQPRHSVTKPVPHRRRAYPNRLTGRETTQIIEALDHGFAAGLSVYSCWHQALDQGKPIASLSSWYRIARTHLSPQRPTRARKTRPARAMPYFQATRPNQVWCWDITKLPGPYLGVVYNLYTIIDAYSRKIIGWHLAASEKDSLARDMFTQAITNEAMIPDMVHSDGGASMTSRALADLYREHGITRSINRPRVSNDNPFIESWFKTLKYRPGRPRYFTSLDHAIDWVGPQIEFYNTHHRHSSLEGHTPASVHDGTWTHIHAQRQATLTALASQHPNRYTQPPQLKTLYATVTLNTPNTGQRLQTG